jgi:type II secretory pathway pseudopilin PulG
MQIKLNRNHRFYAVRSAFTIIEAIVAMAIVGFMVVALYGGITSGFVNARFARENMRATQIMVEKMEVIRLCTWTQINSNGFIPATFTAPYFPKGFNTNSYMSTLGEGLTYNGVISITPVTALELNGAYNDDMRKVTVNVSWTTQNVQRNRQISTYVSRYGIQNYLFN